MGSDDRVMDAAMRILRYRLCNLEASPLFEGLESNRRKLYDLLRHTVCDACNNSALLLGPRGCGKSMVLESVLREMQKTFPDRMSIVRLNGLLHADDRTALKEIAKQLCVEHELDFANAASFDENLRFLTLVLEEFTLSRKALVLVLDEFDLFARKPKQCLLYNLLDLLQSSSSQAAVIGISCRLDADQLLEKRVRSRFSQRKILFLPLSIEEVSKFLEKVLIIPVDQSATLAQHANTFNAKISAWLQMESTKELVKKLVTVDLTPRYIIDSVFRGLCDFLQNRKPTTTSKHAQTVRTLADLSVLELFLLTSMKRLENKEREAYTFGSVFKEYQDGYKSSDSYSKQAAYKAFEHLLEREVIGYSDGKAVSSLAHLRPVKLLVSSEELEQGLDASPVCPVSWACFTLRSLRCANGTRNRRLEPTFWDVSWRKPKLPFSFD